jgi:hypothetical protein
LKFNPRPSTFTKIFLRRRDFRSKGPLENLKTSTAIFLENNGPESRVNRRKKAYRGRRIKSLFKEFVEGLKRGKNPS